MGWSSSDVQSSGMGVILWGNIAAIDIINAKHNEGLGSIRNKDLSVAFVGMKAAEQALHLWYSVFQPISYQSRILPRILKSPTLHNLKGKRAPLTPSTSMHTTFSTSTIAYLMDTLRTPALDPDVASNALNDIMNAPQRVDCRDLYYASIKPSHRVAFEKWRSIGLVLPFGAASAHLSIPNCWLFTKDGHLLLNDNANPFDGWDLAEIFNSGKAHGTTEADLIGSLYFHIMDQLVEFSKIQIYSFDLDAAQLPNTLRSNRSLPQNFDRIEVSNILDKNYIGMNVLSSWGPLLNKANPHAAIVGLFMNWYNWKESADFMASPGDFSAVQKRMSASTYTGFPPSMSSPLDPNMIGLMTSMRLFHDTSKAFEEYLKDEKEDVIIQKVDLKRRQG
ncbi:hypothetical protein F5146DRAFT_1228612 [Armillaria mellea]|nr:hypothetical protein F5146DRAFT_1228612 [Armillaria mellea]